MAVNLVGAGIAEGVTRGLQGYTEGLKQADTIQYQRELRRQQAVQFQTQQTQAEQQIEKNALQLAQLQKQAYGSDVKQAMINFYASGKKNIVMLNSAINSNPDLKKTTFGDLTEFQPLSTYSDETLQTIGYEPSMGDKSDFLVALESDGTKTLLNLNQFSTAIGVVGELQGRELEAQQQQLGIDKLKLEGKEVNAMNTALQSINQKFLNDELTPEQYAIEVGKIKSLFSANGVDMLRNERIKEVTNKVRSGDFTYDDAKLFYEAGKTVGERYDRALTILNNISEEGLKELRNTDNAFVEELRTQALNTAQGKAFQKSWGELAEFNGMLQNFSTAIDALQKGWDPNIASKSVNNLLSYLPASIKGDLNEKDLRDKLGSQSFQTAYLTLLKLISGATVTDGERKNFESAMGSIGRDSTTMLVGIKSLLDSQRSKLEYYSNISKPLFKLEFGTTMDKIDSNLRIIDDTLNNLQNKKATAKEPASNLYKQQGNSSANDLSNIYRDNNSLKSITGASK